MKQFLIVGHLIGAATLLLGCIGHPDLDPGPESAIAATVEHHDAEAAEAGCEDVDAGDLRLARVKGAPGLGALVADDGDVRCVDSLAILLFELGDLPNVDPLASDPSPQPSHPGVGATRSALTRNAPAPLVRDERADPTPTPMSEPSLREDPTPTPMTED